MTQPRLPVALLCLTVVALIVAGCGSSGGSSSSSESTSSPAAGEQTTAAASGTALTGASVSGLGTVLVNPEGFVLYEFAKDKGTTSSCYGACEQAWPPLLTKGAPSAGEGAMSSQLGTSERKDGSMQVTYAGHPLYTFIEDKGPGEANGNGAEAFGGMWWVLDEAGSTVEGSAGSEPEPAPEEAPEEETTESSGGAYGY